MPVKLLASFRRTKMLRIVAGLVALWTVAAALLFVPLAGWTSADVETGRHPGYPELRPHSYDMRPDNTVEFVQAAIGRLSGWSLVKADPAAGVVLATAPGFPAPSDITVTVTPSGVSSRVDIRARSRFGFADLGANARHIRALQAAMDDKLPRFE